MSIGIKKRVLVVEDEPSIVDNVVFGLKQEGFEVEAVGTGVEAIERLRGSMLGSGGGSVSRSATEGNGVAGFSLVVLDVGLPDTTGFEVCKEIRRFSEVPIVFLTARNEEIDKILGLEIGGDDYMVKPFSVRELAARVKVILRRSAAAGTVARLGSAGGETVGITGVVRKVYGEKRYGDFELDEDRYQIAYCGVGLSLTRYEFRLLKLLVKSAGRVLSREQLMYQVWEEPEASGERTVDAHIKVLRSKLRGIDGEKDPIKTHRGVGYSLEIKYRA